MALLAQSPPVHAGVRSIALVGIDGSGKTTQAHRLADELAATGLPAEYRRNAGGRRWVGRLAAVLGKADAHGRADAEDLIGRRAMLGVESVLRWFAILRTLLVRMVSPGRITVLDRYAACQFASLRARGAHPRAERRARLAYRLFPAPDLTFYLSVDPEVAYERIERRGYDHETMAYLRAAVAAYRSLPEHRGFVVIDANGTPDQVNAAIRAALAAHARVAPVPVTVPPQRFPLVRARTLLLAAAPLLAGFAALSWQLAEVL
ncbi:dTMP kinase [Actinoplanes sp. NBRC 101535]|uniref:dTMP kinase n=1 Tax=Actinoplanes sp. NBRC 101535 TaxID=3032196 RepID=UPI0024A0E3EF|nr:dTMP kinase [Actinoplanes sp. NBRC 101535]GLY01370.1 hypothetical protein Acsp01_17490 [Actinoplanes sp. NBRC 101535]